MHTYKDTRLSPNIKYSIDISDLDMPDIPIEIKEPVKISKKEPNKFKEGGSKSLF